ncbi:MAG TPA: hypothetical protein DCQ46_03875 [Lachnospiraceae bacterium]|nr:hypothetical protein [Lachnospiraceae bacterium]
MADNREMLLGALEFIENNIAGNITVDDVAEHLYVSVSGLQKTFKYVFHTSVKEYIIRRRFSCAAQDLVQSQDNVLDIALKYGYSSHESFTRGFKKVWGITPVEFRKHRHFTGHTPKLAPPEINESEDVFMSGIRYSIDQLYDVLQERKNNAYVCADLVGLMHINDTYGRKAGDAAILEIMKRLEEACGENDLLLRIGGDEFVVFTTTEDIAYANAIIDKAFKKNGETINVEGAQIPVSIHGGAFSSPKKDYHVNVDEVFSMLKDNIDTIHKQ